MWGRVLDFLTTWTTTAHPSSFRSALAISSLLDTTKVPLLRVQPQSFSPFPGGTPCRGLWGGRGAAAAAATGDRGSCGGDGRAPCPFFPTVCRAWAGLFRGPAGAERRPQVWLQRAFRVPALSGGAADAHEALERRLQVVRSFNAANAARSLQVSPEAAAAGLDPFQVKPLFSLFGRKVCRGGAP